MFKVTTEPKFKHPVTVYVPIDGGHLPQTFHVTFRALDADKLQSVDTDGFVTNETMIEAQKETLRRIIVSMDDLVDDNDQPLPYSDALREQLIAQPYVRIALNTAYTKAMTKAKAGN